MIRHYRSDYLDYFPEEWTWSLKNTKEDRKLYRRYRMRHSNPWYKDNDKLPFFDSIEKDANQFGFDRVEFVDIFGIHWEGEKGCHHYVGEPDFEQHLYYWDDEEKKMLVSDLYTQSNLPVGFARIGENTYYDVINIVNLKYHWILENHLFKDSHVTVSYDQNVILLDDEWDEKYPKGADIETIFDITDFAIALMDFNKDALYQKLCEEVDVHLLALRDSPHSDERAFWPGKTADEYFRELKKYRARQEKNNIYS